MTTYAYIRVSSKEQNEGRQRFTMKQQGVEERNIYCDKISGKDTGRPEYQSLKLKVKPNDTVIFDSLTRMSRTKDDIKKEYQHFIDRQISLKFINEPMLNYDVNKVENDPVMRAIPEMILTLLSAFAEKERNDIKRQQREGIDNARRNGVHLGRPRISYDTMNDEQKQLFIEQYRRWKDGQQTAVETMRNVNLKKSTFYKIVKEYEALKNDKKAV